jgi:N-acetylglucosamine kinase-like BadF-type ATPase
MKYYMSVDGGGTKLIAILFDESFNCLGVGRGGAINANFESMAFIEKTMEGCIAQCLSGNDIKELEKIYISMPGPYEMFLSILRSKLKIADYDELGEGSMSLLAGLQRTTGGVALAGTGSAAFWVGEHTYTHAGGWGSLLGDEGSGFYIGSKGLTAAIHSYEKRGKATSILNIVMKEWKLNKLWDMVPKIYQSSSPRLVVASAAPLISMAAREGDAVALEILYSAGEEMAKQILCLSEYMNIQGTIYITIAGGAWKGHEIMFKRFCELVKVKLPQAEIAVPLFEPVMGGVIAEYLKANGSINKDCLEKIKKNYQLFIYKANW